MLESVNKLVNFVLELLTVDLILNVINSVVQLGDVHFTIFITGFSMLESVNKLVNFVLQLLFTFLSLLSRDLKLLHVLTNSLKFLLNIPQFAFSQLSTLIGPLQLILLDTQFPGKLIKLLFVVTGHLGGFPQVLVSLLNLYLIPHGLVLKVFDLLQDTIGILGSKSQLCDSFGQ